MEVIVRWVSADDRVLDEDHPVTRPGFTWHAPIPPCAATLHITFGRPQPVPCEAGTKLHTHVLAWLRREQGIADAAEVVGVTGFGSDGPGDFPRAFSVGVHWRNRAGSEQRREFSGDAAVSLLYWTMAAMQPSRES